MANGFSWDSFVEASTISLGSHTPTGANAGAAWQLTGSAGVNVIGGSNIAQDTNTANGNRCLIAPSISTEDMTVSCDLAFVGAVGGSDFVFPGLIYRSTNFLSSNGGEFYFQLPGTLFLGSTSKAFTWPGGTVNFTLVCSGPSVYGYVNGNLELTLTDTMNRGGTYCGIIFGNFQGDASKHISAANFKANPLTTSAFYLTA